jgi:hypothetical protein
MLRKSLLWVPSRSMRTVDGRTDMSKLMITFPNLVNAPKKQISYRRMRGQNGWKFLSEEGEGRGTGRKVKRDFKKFDELENEVTTGSGVLLEQPIFIQSIKLFQLFWKLKSQYHIYKGPPVALIIAHIKVAYTFPAQLFKTHFQYYLSM